jgi:uncharacterized protein YigA (DUF484 family)
VTEEDVIEYLENNPHILLKQIELFQKSSDADTATTRDEKIISLSDRQVPQMQQKIRLLENQIVDFLDNGRRNEKIWDSLLTTSLALFSIKHEHVTTKLIESTLCAQLAIERCRIFIVSRQTQQPNNKEKAILSFLATADGPKCFIEPPAEIEQLTNAWMLASSAFVPISSDNFQGVLIFSSSDIDKYEPDVDTQFLARIGNVVSTILEHVSHRDTV